jgi:hypothetical protein
MLQSSNLRASSHCTPDSLAPGYVFSAFSAADVPYFRCPFAYAVYGHAIAFSTILISFLNATIVSVEDMDRVENVEGSLRERLQTEPVRDAVFGTLDSDAWRGLKLTKGIFVCGLNRSGRLEYANMGQLARLVGENGTVTDLSGETGEATLATGVALVVGNAAFTREIHPDRLAAAFQGSPPSGRQIRELLPASSTPKGPPLTCWPGTPRHRTDRLRGGSPHLSRHPGDPFPRD